MQVYAGDVSVRGINQGIHVKLTNVEMGLLLLNNVMMGIVTMGMDAQRNVGLNLDIFVLARNVKNICN